jgi:hypothetical protein
MGAKAILLLYSEFSIANELNELTDHLPLPSPMKGGGIYKVPSPLVGEGKGEGYVNLFLTL